MIGDPVEMSSRTDESDAVILSFKMMLVVNVVQDSVQMNRCCSMKADSPLE